MSEMNILLLCNPYGTDVSTYMAPTGGNIFLGPIMKGTMLPAGRELYTFGPAITAGQTPYAVNISSIANITALANLIQTKLSSFTSGHIPGRKIVLFGYSQGNQGICLWYDLYGAACPIDPLDMEIVMIGHAASRYSGFIYERTTFNAVGYIHDIALGVKYPTRIVTQQYDGVGDFPTSSIIHDAYEFIASPPAGAQPYNIAMAEMNAVIADPVASKALNNAMYGMSTIHNNYQNVTLADTNMRWYDEPGTLIRYGVSPHWPATSYPQDYAAQDTIELSYNRPQGTIPYLIPKTSGVNIWTPVPTPRLPVYGVGWWVKVHKRIQFSLTPTVNMQAIVGIQHVVAPAMLTPTMSMAVKSHSKALLPFALTPSVLADVRSFSKGALAFSLTPNLMMIAKEHYKNTIQFSLTPTALMAAREEYRATELFTLTPVVDMAGKGKSKATVSFALTMAITEAVRSFSKGTVAFTLTPSASMAAHSHFVPSNVTTTQTNAAVPAGTAGCWVTLIGSGGGGGTCPGASFASIAGAGGGGGGAKITRVFIPSSLLGATYSTVLVTGGASATNGGTCSFVSGGVTLAAGGGTKGSNGTNGGAGGAGGGGGPFTFTATGITSTGINGTAGGTGGTSAGAAGGAAANNATGSAPGGGGGGARNSGGTSFNGGKGGDSAVSGGAGGVIGATAIGTNGTAATAGNAGGGGGGGGGSNDGATTSSKGGIGGVYGAGGGGAGGNNVTTQGGAGADGYLLIEWV